jgi:hypothetical protein
MSIERDSEVQRSTIRVKVDLMKARIMCRSIIYWYVIFIVTALILWIILRNLLPLNHNVDVLEALSFIAIGLFGVYSLTKGVLRSGISLCVIHWYFVLVFFFLVAFLQYLGHLFTYTVGSDSVLTGNILVLLWCVIYSLSYRHMVEKQQRRSLPLSLFVLGKSRPGVLRCRLCLLSLMSLLVGCSLIWVGGIASFYTRGSYTRLVAALGGWGPLALIVTYYVRPLLFCIFVIFVGIAFLYKKIKKTPATCLCLVVLLFLNAVINNVFSYPRFMLFTMTFGLAVLFLYRKVRASLVYVLALCVGLPLSHAADIFRLPSSEMPRASVFVPTWNFIFLGSFDVYENFIHTIDSVKENGVVYGKQLAGALLFFVPRSIWTDKPLGSGTYIAQFLATKYDVVNFNIGNPLISEMYLNFHVLGIMIGAFLYGTVTALLDRRYWMSVEQGMLGKTCPAGTMDLYRLLYPFLLGLYLFHLRGDFMSSFGYGTGFVLAFTTVVTFLTVRIGEECKT